MTITPEYGEEERMKQQEAQAKQPSERVRPRDHGAIGEREMDERKRAERESAYLEPEDNEAHAPGKVCERCGAVITASQDVRRLADGNWIHEACPRRDVETSDPTQ